MPYVGVYENYDHRGAYREILVIWIGNVKPRA